MILLKMLFATLGLTGVPSLRVWSFGYTIARFTGSLGIVTYIMVITFI